MNRRAFTLIELLTVIAIIAILAAIIFPVFSAVRGNAYKSSCESNLHQIHTALKLYHGDYQAYPQAMMGYVETYQNNVVPVTNLKYSPLYPDKIESIDGFKCPLNRDAKPTTVVPGNLVFFPSVKVFDGNQWAPANNLAGQPVGLDFYTWDSYDIGKVRGPGGAEVYELHYMLFWTEEGLAGGGRDDDPRQLGYARPHSDAVVTWCTYHRDYGGPENAVPKSGKNDIVLFLSGTVKVMDSRDVADRGFGVMPR